MGLDNAGVGVDRKERVQVEKVCRILEEPPLLGFAMADQLNVSQMAAVDRRHVATRPPTRVARHMRIRFVGTVREILREEIPALVWKVCLYLVDCFHFRAVDQRSFARVLLKQGSPHHSTMHQAKDAV